MVIITSGKRFTDIDALASAIGYAEIDPNYKVVLPGPLNQSVPHSIRKWGLNFEKNYKPNPEDKFVVVDVSEDDQMPTFVKPEKIIELYDHHFSFEPIWLKRPWVKTKIEDIGACATLIWEEILKRRSGVGDQLSESNNPLINQSTNQLVSPTTANLLYTAIASNTLYFKAQLTKDRDRQAFEELKQYINLPEDWSSTYYREVEADVHIDPYLSVENDTKIANLGGQTIAIGQIELWSAQDFILGNKNEISSALRSFETELWLFTSPCIGKGFNYVFTPFQTVKEWLKMHIGATFPANNDLGTTRKLWVRKEILRELVRG